MSEDIDRYVKDPSLLVTLCTAVIDELDPSSDDLGVTEREAQLREISKAIERLEKTGVPVPDALRAEKTRLAASLAIHADATQALTQLADEFQNILADLRERLGQTTSPAAPKVKRKRSHAAKTESKVLREYIIRALKTLGGRGRVADVIEEMGRQLEGKLLPGDIERYASTGQYIWQNSAQWERLQMTQEGLLRRGSPRGIWELGEDL